MSEMDFRGLESGADWEAVARLIARVETDRVTDFDVVRLRSAVNRTLAPAERRIHGWALRFAAVAATVVVGAVALFAVMDGREAPMPTSGAPGAAVAVSLSQTGAVVFQFGDGATVHRIAKATSPAPGAPTEVKVARGRTFVDHNGQPRPGQVVFYRID